MANVKSYINHEFSSGGFVGSDYVAFEKTCRSELRRTIKKIGVNLHKFNRNHYEWSAVLEKDGKFVYIHLGDVRFFDWYNSVLIRSMAHDTDWHGGYNNHTSWDKINDVIESVLSHM